jgi:putative ABC transport system permease protein
MTAILILAIGIGANTTVFSIANAVLIKSLPYPAADNLMTIFEARPRERVEENFVSIADFLDWREQNSVFSSIAAYEGTTWAFTGRGEPEHVQGAVVTTRFFEALGVTPSIGSTFDPADEDPGTSRAVVVTNGFWQRRLGGDRSVIGQTISLDGSPYEIIGVMPRDFIPPGRTWEIFGAMKFDAGARNARSNHNLEVLARLKPGVAVAQARQEMDVISKRLESSFQVNRGHYANVVPFEQKQRGKLQPAMRVLLAAVGLVLLIACFNVANLLLARSVTRAREVSIRMALGATRLRIVRQLLLESVTLSLIGAAAGLFIAAWSADYLKTLVPLQLGLAAEDLRIDAAVLAFTTVVAVASGLLFGLAPAFTAIRSSVNDVLRSGSWQQTWSAWRHRQRAAIVAAEMALSVLLLVGAGLLIRSFANLLDVDPGFRPEKLLTMGVALSAPAYRDDSKKIAFQKELIENVSRLPGVVGAGITSFLPVSGQNSRMGLVIEGIEPDTDEPRRANWRIVTPGYIEAMQIPLRQGRLFAPADTKQMPIVMVINETAANKYWHGRDPIGTRARLATMKGWATVVGVVGDVKHWGLDAPSNPEAYLSLWQAPFWLNNLVVRTHGDPLRLAQAIRQVLSSMDKDLPPQSIRSMEDVIDRSTALRRFHMLLLGILAGIALVLAVAGAYAQLAYSVSQRMREIGLRIALGASSPAIMRQIVRQGLRMSIAGVAVGLAGAMALSRLLEKLLFGVKPLDPVTLLIAPLMLLVSATLASLIPSWRACRTDPARSLRYE